MKTPLFCCIILLATLPLPAQMVDLTFAPEYLLPAYFTVSVDERRLHLRMYDSEGRSRDFFEVPGRTRR